MLTRLSWSATESTKPVAVYVRVVPQLPHSHYRGSETQW
ncbi:hypothetical protein QFZ70_002955 [Arthrobacter sp. V1I9]|nr:hypothetical protein [Arthrobacter sp. V1I9]